MCLSLKMRTPISLRRTRLLRICIVAAIVVPIIYLTLTWSDEKGKSIHSQLFASRTPREAPKLVSGKLNEIFFLKKNLLIKMFSIELTLSPTERFED